MAANSIPLEALEKSMVLAPVPAAHWLVIAPPVWCLLLGAILIMVRKRPGLQAWLAIPALAALVLIDAALLFAVTREGPVTMVMGRWLPPFGIAFTVDLTGALFNLTGGIAALAGGIAALGDIDRTKRAYGFYPFLLLMVGGVSGAFLTGDIFNLYVWFEVLLISSFGLIILGSERAQLDGATKYAILNLIGTTLFLIAVGILYAVFGTLNMADIAAKAPKLGEIPPLMTLGLIFIAAFSMKAAAFPVNFWLPASYHTPRIVVAGLFAGLLTKVGVYALLRVMVMIFPQEGNAYSLLIGVVAILTMLTGALGALAQSDLRRMLGYIVITGIGIILSGVALGGQTAIAGALFYAMHSMIVMLALYLMAGVAGRMGGSFSLHDLSGLYARSPLLAAITLALFFSVSGLPPFSGFWPKAMLVKATFDFGAWWQGGVILVSGLLTTIAVMRAFALGWWRMPVSGTVEPARIEASEAVPLVGLTLLSLGIGLYPEPLLALAQTAAAGLLEPTAYLHSVFPGLSPLGGPLP
ncbi:Na+/H+ antiporter subunit D [Rhizobium sp. C1]|uniref:Na+/H+ antiporter subunit D n=1 Tax=Rhizobium sp. C1 TaxID=1349799 RepID=UPI001E42DFF1|nr:Na+/H+ antiporter subunit D [Rhizobium sp. C1]MCD2177431.1 Na+/H+ antiporter subunit D [Rhizobium sp. C1]